MNRGKYKLINGLFVINLLCSWSRKCHYREGNFKCGLQKFKMHHYQFMSIVTLYFRDWYEFFYISWGSLLQTLQEKVNVLMVNGIDLWQQKELESGKGIWNL